ncbi:hypothetical protein D3C74_331950 [compost metagenome]
MKHEHVRTRNIYGALEVSCCETIVQLHRAQVGNDRNVRCPAADIKCAGEFRLFHGSPDRTYAERPASGVCYSGEALIDSARCFASTRHRTDEQGCTYFFANKRSLQMHLFKIQLRQWVMTKRIPLHTAGYPFSCHILLKTEAHVFQLPFSRSHFGKQPFAGSLLFIHDETSYVRIVRIDRITCPFLASMYRCLMQKTKTFI